MESDSKTLLKILIASGTGSRRPVADLIRNGKVSVNDEYITDFKYPVNVKTDTVKVAGKVVRLSSDEKIVLMINKPAGVLSTTHDERGRTSVLEIIPIKYKHLGLYPVGRLDKDTTGLLLLTNDGDLTYRITHPKFELEKEYLVGINRPITQEERKLLENGVLLEDGLTSHAVIKPSVISPTSYRVILHEGKKRQIRRMFEKMGRRVLSLKRVRIGGLYLGDLGEGEIRTLKKTETELLLKPEKHDARSKGHHL